MGRKTKISKAFVAKYKHQIELVQNQKDSHNKIPLLQKHILDQARFELGFSKQTKDTQIWRRIIKEYIRL